MGSDGITVRAPATEELSECLDVIAASIRGLASTHYSERQLESWIGQYPSLDVFERWRSDRAMVIALAETGITGYGIARLEKGQVEGVHVRPENVRRGVGRRILDALERRATTAGRERLVVDVSLNAEAFYLACGYTPCGPTTFTCRNGTTLDAVHMEKRLGGDG